MQDEKGKSGAQSQMQDVASVFWQAHHTRALFSVLHCGSMVIIGSSDWLTYQGRKAIRNNLYFVGNRQWSISKPVQTIRVQ
jgi:hypothetical protein